MKINCSRNHLLSISNNEWAFNYFQILNKCAAQTKTREILTHFKKIPNSDNNMRDKWCIRKLEHKLLKKSKNQKMSKTSMTSKKLISLPTKRDFYIICRVSLFRFVNLIKNYYINKCIRQVNYKGNFLLSKKRTVNSD